MPSAWGSGVARRLSGLCAALGVLAASPGGALATALQPVDAIGDPRILYFETLPELATLADALSSDGHQAGKPSRTVPEVVGKPRSSRRQLSFDAYGRRFDMSLETNDRLSDALPSPSAASLALYRGSLEGNSRSWVRLAAKGGQVHGMIWDGTELYVIEPAAAAGLGAVGAQPAGDDAVRGSAGDRRVDASVDAMTERSTPVIFRLADVLVEPGTASCAASPGKTPETERSADGVDPFGTAPGDADVAKGMSKATRGDTAYGALLQELKGSAALMQAAGATHRLTLSILGDPQFRQRYASAQDAQDAIMIRLNHVDGIYSAQLGIELRVDALFVEGPLSRSFSNTTLPDSLLSELASLRARWASLHSRGLTHLFTGRDLDGTTVGIAYMDALCDTRHGAALTQARGSWQDALVTAHEIGHNFGAPHDGEGACIGEPPGLMAPAISGLDTFSQCSLEQMDLPVRRALAARCITALPPANVAVARNLGAARHPVSLPFDWHLEIRNEGGLTAHDVRAELVVPPAMIIEDASVVGGSCTSGAGVVQCQLGQLPGGASRRVDLRLYSDSIGTHSIAANVSAADDAHSFDNRGDGSIQIDPQADLAVTLRGPSTITVDQIFTLELSASNASRIDVDHVTIVLDLPPGFTASSAAIGDVGCLIQNSAEGQQLHCALPVLQAGARADGSVALSASRPGSGDIVARISGDYLDPVPDNDVAGITLHVNAPSSSVQDGNDSRGGGGSMGAPLLLGLVSLAGLRARRRR